MPSSKVTSHVQKHVCTLTAAVGLDETTATKSFRARGILGFILLREYHMGEPRVVAGTACLRDVCGGL